MSDVTVEKNPDAPVGPAISAEVVSTDDGLVVTEHRDKKGNLVATTVSDSDALGEEG